jgi:hypothetical protein
MKSALPYLGIVLVLMILAIFISFFLNGNFGAKEEVAVEDEIVKANDFPEVGEAERQQQTEVSDNNTSFLTEDATEEESENSVEDAPDKIIAGLLKKIQKQAEITSSSFKWQKSGGGAAIAFGFQTRFQGSRADIFAAKEYLKNTGFFLDINNQITNNEVSIEGFSRQPVVCIVSGDSDLSNGFTVEQEDPQEGEIRVDCGKLKQ